MEIVLVLDLGASDMPSLCHCACSINSHLEASDEFFETSSEVEQEMETNDLPTRHAQHSETRLPNDNHMEDEATLPTFHSVTEAQWKGLSQEKRDRAYLLITEGLAAFPTVVLGPSSQHIGADFDNELGTTSDPYEEWYKYLNGLCRPFPSSDNEWNSASDVTAKLHERLVKALDPFSNPEYEISDDNDSQSEDFDSPPLTPTSSDEEESEGLGSLHDLTPEENLIFLQMGDIMYNLLEKADPPFGAPLPPLFTAWRQFEMAMFASDTGR